MLRQQRGVDLLVGREAARQPLAHAPRQLRCLHAGQRFKDWPAACTFAWDTWFIWRVRIRVCQASVLLRYCGPLASASRRSTSTIPQQRAHLLAARRELGGDAGPLDGLYVLLGRQAVLRERAGALHRRCAGEAAEQRRGDHRHLRALYGSGLVRVDGGGGGGMSDVACAGVVTLTGNQAVCLDMIAGCSTALHHGHPPVSDSHHACAPTGLSSWTVHQCMSPNGGLPIGPDTAYAIMPM